MNEIIIKKKKIFETNKNNWKLDVHSWWIIQVFITTGKTKQNKKKCFVIQKKEKKVSKTNFPRFLYFGKLWTFLCVDYFRFFFLLSFVLPSFLFIFFQHKWNRCRYEYMKSLKFLIKIYSTFIYLSSKTIKNRAFISEQFFLFGNIFLFCFGGNENE